MKIKVFIVKTFLEGYSLYMVLEVIDSQSKKIIDSSTHGLLSKAAILFSFSAIKTLQIEIQHMK